MGLDMEIRRVSNPHIDGSIVYDRSELSGKLVFDKSDIEKPMFKQIAPYVQLVKVKNSYYDMENIRKDFKLSDNAYIGMISTSSIGIRDSEHVREFAVTIPTNIVEQKYTIERVEECYVCDCSEVAYWRKNYEIQNWFHNQIECPVENTGMYILPLELILKFNKKFRDDALIALEPDDESALFYWEWY